MPTYAIGDIHGCLTALKRTFDTITFHPDDTIVFLGDYVDRGPQSKQVIDFLLEIKSQFKTVFIRGNHDIMMMNASKGIDIQRWLTAGGVETLDSYGIKDNHNWSNQISKTHQGFLESTIPYYQLKDHIFVHGGLEVGVRLSQQTDHNLYWQKYEVPTAYRPDKVVVCGHTARKNGKVANFGHTICIDTFAFGGQWLTCLNVESGEYVQTNQLGEVLKKNFLSKVE